MPYGAQGVQPQGAGALAQPANASQAANTLRYNAGQPMQGNNQQPISAQTGVPQSPAQGLPALMSQLSTRSNNQNNLQSVPVKLGG